MRKLLTAILILSLPSAVAIVVYYYATKKEPTKRDAVGQVATVAGTGQPGTDDGARQTARFSDPFGIAIDKRGNVIVADGGQSNRIKKITEKGEVQTIAGSTEGFADGNALEAQFNTPSGLVIDKDANLIIADTSNNRIRKLSPEGRVSTIAGSGIRGFKDGAASEAEFDGPVGVAVDKNGNIFVADAYNDRIRKITTDGNVITVAGAGTPGFQDGDAASALFDTPSGVAVDKEGNAFIADTGNGAIRKITPQGEVATIAKRDDPTGDAELNLARLNRPAGIVVTHDGFLFVADAGSNRVVRIAPEGTADPYAGRFAGFADGFGLNASFNAPAGMAMDRDGVLYVSDAQNYLIRMIKPATAAPGDAAEKQEPEVFIQPATEPINTNADDVIPRLSRSSLNIGQVFPWPLNPQYQWHEVAGVVGEARGAPGGIALDHLHAGLDVRGQMGEPAVSVIDEKVSALIPAWGFDGSNEGIHLGLMSYIHIRVGRDANNQIQLPDKFKARLDQTGKVASIRVRRGTRFKVGDFIGTLNRLYHVHLNFGPWNAVANAIEFPFVDFKDTVAPTIETDGIEVVSSTGTPFKQKVNNRLLISGDVDIIATAYDRVDGNVSSRKLGLYRAGYQVLKEDRSAVLGFDPPVMNIEFNRLPPDDLDVFLVYGKGSGVSAYGTPTKFKYILTNRVRDGEARDGLLRTSALAPGNYIIKVIAEDFAGNRASGKSTELPITIQR